MASDFTKPIGAIATPTTNLDKVAGLASSAQFSVLLPFISFSRLSPSNNYRSQAGCRRTANKNKSQLGSQMELAA